MDMDTSTLAFFRVRLDREFEELKDIIMELVKKAYAQGSQDRFVALNTKRSEMPEERP